MTHYFTNDPNVVSNEKEVMVTIKDKNYKFVTDNGVFSKRGMDFGTRTLLETIPLENISGNVLDFGCGYGPIGIFVATNTNACVDMVDINLRSINLTKKNAKLNNAIVDVFESDTYSNVSKKYDFIITNPPIRVGKEKLYEILFDAKKHMNNGGELWIVINKNQGAKSLVKDLEKQYTTSVVVKNKGFYIIMAVNN